MSADEVGTPSPAAAAESLCKRFGHIPLRLSADLTLPSLSMRELRELKPGQVIASSWSVADDLLLTLGGSPLCWGRFAAVEGRMVLRVVRLA